MSFIKLLIGGIDHELSRVSHRALSLAGKIILKKPRCARGYEVRYTTEGWMIFETDSLIPIRLFNLKADAVKEARKLSRGARVRLTIQKRRPQEPQ